MGGWPVGYLQGVEELNSGPPKTNPSSDREEDLNPGPPDYKSSILPLGHARLSLLYHFLANWLAHNKKMTEKSVFREAWNPELTSQSFPLSCFWCRGFVPHRKWNLTLLAHQNTRKENRYRKYFLLHLSAHWGYLIEQINEINKCRIHFNWNSCINECLQSTRPQVHRSTGPHYFI